MIRVAVDSDQPDVLRPGLAPVVLTYADLFQTPAQLAAYRAERPLSEVVLFDRGFGDPTGEASVFDVERGLLTIDQAVKHFDRQHERGIEYLTMYANRSNLAAVDAAMGTREFYRFVARLDGVAWIPGFPPTVYPALVQVLNEQELGIHADLSLIYNQDWHPSPLAVPVSTWMQAHEDARALERSLGASAGLLAHLHALTGL